MKYSVIPGTDISVSKICLGTMTFGSPVPETEAIHLVRYAMDEHGINFVDTANMYEGYNRYAGSSGGVAEEILGKAVAGRRDRFVLATKVGMKVGNAPEDENTSPLAIATQLRRSLHRMNTDYVDLYYLHRFQGFQSHYLHLHHHQALHQVFRVSEFRKVHQQCLYFPEVQILLENM